ncbi:SAM-dependent methyltransferase [Streptomyces sp. F-3]|uniref:class I SAM-dependent DNA methyltransferase n=1 Tax=Streptomyces TaxID=1883 RepID=UPI0007C3B14C|nr:MULTISPECIES: class I SAM-dependent methyltransferase [Streptomyces]GAT84625.1 SAM-dependent methyltransferase [Streptomyces sp. F-3]
MSEASGAASGTTGIYDLGDVYDAIYRGRGKDYRAESAVVTEHIRFRFPNAASLLDVGCGTGGHLVHFAQEFAEVRGIGLSDGMLEAARRRLPGVPLERGDMRSFRLDGRFDAVVCLFAAVGNLTGTDELAGTLASFARHLVPGGVVVLEPWWFPENFTPGYVDGSVVAHNGMTVARVSRTVPHETRDAGRMDVHCLVARPGQGVQHFSDTHVMALYSRAQYEAAFTGAGLTVEYVTGEYPGNGLFIGIKQKGE